MKLLEGKIYIEWRELIEAGVPEGSIKSGIQRQSAGWCSIQDPSDARKVLIAFDPLSDKYKNMVRIKFGDPNDLNKACILDKYLTVSNKDLDFLKSYRLPDGRALPTKSLNEYINACKLLSWLLTTSNRDSARMVGFTDLRSYWEAVGAYIQKNNISLPKHRNKLQLKLEAYKLHGAKSVISQKFCNINSKKVSNEICAALLLELIGHHNQFEDTFVALKYNEWAQQEGFKTITPATVGNYRHRHLIEVTNPRQGSSVWRNLFDKSVHQDRPSAPLLLINSDDNVLDLYFLKESINKKGHKHQNYYHRVTLMVIMDSFNDYPLGYAIGDGQTIDLVKEAYLNAVHHVKELTGETYLWHQIKADSWGLGALRSWYEEQATFTPPRTGNARGKVIEQAFGQNWHRMLRQYPNYAGHNITAQKRLNPDAIQAIKKNFPPLDHAPLQVADFINRLRNQVMEKKQMTKQQYWLKVWNETALERKRSLSDASRLMIFGKRHEYTNTITKDGLKVTINGEKFTYEVPTADYRKYVGTTLKIAYDPYDLNSILAYSDDMSVQIHCHAYQNSKMAIADMNPGDRFLLNVKLDEKRETSQWVLDATAKRKELLQRTGINAESILQAGVLVKELRSESENVFQLAQLNAQRDEDVFDDMDLPEPLNLNNSNDED